MAFFICYPSERVEAAKVIARTLTQFHVQRWFDKDSIIGGKDWDRERKRALQNASAIIVVCSQDFHKRDGVFRREVNEALELFKDKRPDIVFIIPITLDDGVDLGDLGRFQSIKFTDADFDLLLANSIKEVLRQQGLNIPEQLEIAAARTTDKISEWVEISKEPTPYQGEYYARYPLYKEDGFFWEYVNSEIKARILRAYFTSNEGHFGLWDDELFDFSHISVEEFFISGDLLSLKFTWFLGERGNHHTRNFETLNFAGSNYGLLRFENIFSDPWLAEEIIAREIADDLERQEHLDTFLNEIRGKKIDRSLMDEFNFNRDGMRFTFGSYIYYHYHHIYSYVPWASLRRVLKPQFAKALDLQFLE